MKVYQLRMGYFDGDHDHGIWESPLFARREDAESFQAELIAMDKREERSWWSDAGMITEGPEGAYIVEIEVIENFNGHIPAMDSMLRIFYT